MTVKRLKDRMDMHTVRRARAMIGGDETEWADSDAHGLCIHPGHVSGMDGAGPLRS